MSRPAGGSSLVSRAWRSPLDTRLMEDLASARLGRDWPAARLHPGDIDWWAVLLTGREMGLVDRVRLWFTDAAESELAGFGWFAPPAELDFLQSSDEDDEIEAFVAELVAWATTRRAELAIALPDPGDGLRVWASLEERAAIAALEGIGHRLESGNGYVHFTADLEIADAWSPMPLPAGYQIRPLDRDLDLEGRVACGRAAFGNTTMTVDRYRAAFGASRYRPDLDLVVSNPAGDVIAFALGWLDVASGVVELEPVGVHPEWHRRGLGRAACQATLGAARPLGARRALIGADPANSAAIALYSALGLRITTTIAAFIGPTPSPASDPDPVPAPSSTVPA